MVNLNNLFSRISELGLNATTVAEATGISTGNISDWKKGRSMPSAAKLDILADYLNCSTDYLLGRTDAPNAEKPASAKGDGQSEIYDIIESLSPDNRAKLLELARLFLDAQHKSEEKK